VYRSAGGRSATAVSAVGVAGRFRGVSTGHIFLTARVNVPVMYDVLVPVDDDVDRANAMVDAVTSLPCAAEEIRVTILNIEKEIDVVGGEGGHVDSEEWYDESDLPQSVLEARDALEDAAIDVEVIRRHTDPAEGIQTVAEEIDADQIVMSGRKKTPVGKVLFGSVMQSVLLSADRPVTVVGR
jgi:nucleotide-binding universal stress UspA family protein